MPKYRKGELITDLLEVQDALDLESYFFFRAHPVPVHYAALHHMSLKTILYAIKNNELWYAEEES